MSLLLFLFTILILFQVCHQQNPPERVNEGASTSRQDINNCEHCELENSAIRTINLMLAEETIDNNITNTTNDNSDELQMHFTMKYFPILYSLSTLLPNYSIHLDNKKDSTITLHTSSKKFFKFSKKHALSTINYGTNTTTKGR